MVMIPTSGRWNAEDRGLFFLACTHDMHRWTQDQGYTNHLIAVNDLCDMASGKFLNSGRELLDYLLERNARILVDSGIFWLTNRHKRAHQISMDTALALAPDEIDGFDGLWSAYCTIAREYGDKVWGMIELDQGGATNKRITRAKLRDLGINPMPVYHPLNDGWNYLDELIEETDRMCMGNIVQASPPVRVRLLHMLAARHAKNPDLFVHVLGLSPNAYTNAFPSDSCDSSSWSATSRWGKGRAFAMGRAWPLLREVQSRSSAGEARDAQCAMDYLTMLSLARSSAQWQARLKEEFGFVPYAWDAPEKEAAR